MPVFDITGNRYQGLNTFFQMVALNILYLVCCIPVFTIGAATSALLEVMLKFSDNERGYLLRDFLAAFKRNFGRGTAVFAMLGIPIIVALFAAMFWVQSGVAGSVIGYAAAILLGLFIALLVGALVIALGLVAGYAAPLRQTVGNAVKLALAEPLRTLALVAIPVAMFAIAYVLPVFWFLWGTIGFSLAGYIGAIIVRQIFRKHDDAETDNSDKRPQNPSLLLGSFQSPHSGE